ncbi:helix-turn-helix domain-containing protein [Reyranella sp.]|uniref:AraC family transcriptional regulator n=1 Tax=Reyranella sp. TaxID=1929291 RepID=UPI003D0E127E
MAGFGTDSFADPDDFSARLASAEVRFVVTGRARFAARLSWIDMRCLRLLVVEEGAPRLAFISLPPASVAISFSFSRKPSLVWNGIALQRNGLVLHRPGDQFYQRVTGAAHWGLLLLSSSDLARHRRALLGGSSSFDFYGLVHPCTGSGARLRRLIAQGAHLAGGKPALLASAEVARALEQDLIHAVVTALGSAEPDRRFATRNRRAAAMVRFEEALAGGGPGLSLPGLCAAVGVPERTLRVYCADFLGCSPMEYARLRRFNLARSALRDADRGVTGVAEIARSIGFSDPGRFAVAYRALFGEAPLETLARPKGASST